MLAAAAVHADFQDASGSLRTLLRGSAIVATCIRWLVPLWHLNPRTGAPMKQAASLKTFALVAVSATATTFLMQACGGEANARSSAPDDGLRLSRQRRRAADQSVGHHSAL